MTDKIFTKAQLEEKLKEQLSKRADRAQEALRKLFSLQTASEQHTGSTHIENNVGFTGFDAGILSSLAHSLEEWGSLTDKQNAVLFKLMPKYAHQLIELSISEGKIVKLARGKYTW